jgi:hypothetical protein
MPHASRDIFPDSGGVFSLAVWGERGENEKLSNDLITRANHATHDSRTGKWWVKEREISVNTLEGFMKKFAILIVAALFMFFWSCSPAITPSTSTYLPSTSTTYGLYKNFGAISAKGVQDGTPFIGVLLKFSGEGNYNSTVKPYASDVFSLYCLFSDIGVNGDGMQFNYVLYVPQDIQDQFTVGGGTNPASGDPFWWYAFTYLGLSITEINTNWPSALNRLLTSTSLPKANSTDVIGAPWK